MSEVLVRAYRGDAIESLHHGAAVVVDLQGRLLHRTGDSNFVTFLRSSAKPFQALVVVESGAAEAFGFSQKEIAIIAGSHNGESKHVRLVRGILKKIGLNKSYLQCGWHVPHYYTARGITPPRKRFSSLQHNCSAKHAGMLAACVNRGWNISTYLSPRHPLQKLIAKTIAEVCEYPLRKMGIGMEGCGAPTFALPLRNMAIGFSKLRSFLSDEQTISQSLQVVADSMWKYPEMVSGKGRLDHDLAVISKGNILAKAGAEALHCAVVIDKGYGIAVKILDGSRRAIGPAALEVYRQMGVLNRTELRKLRLWNRPPVKDHKGRLVGHLEAAFKLRKARGSGRVL
jgi:L-asparaginase II